MSHVQARRPERASLAPWATALLARARSSTGIALAFVLLASAWSTAGRAQEIMHYEPPAVDFVYPAIDAGTLPFAPQSDASRAPDAAPNSAAPEGDAGVPSAHTNASDAALPGAAGSGQDASAPEHSAADAGIREVALPPVTELPSESGENESESGESDYGAQATVRRAPPAGTHEIALENARDLPGAFGDPLRVLEALPGVVPIASGVPYAYVRGAPPASQGYVYDDIPLPQLFHAAFGPAVIHPRATGGIRFDAGVPSARYGRRAGGLLLAEGTPYGDKFDAELELRLIDVGGWAQGSIGKGQGMISGRIGYPKLALLAAESLNAVKAGTKLNYWDGQVRYRYPLSRRDQAELVWIGSFDDIALPGVNSIQQAGATRLQFHRIETRYVHRLARGEFGAALRFGFDQSALGDALSVRAFTFGPRFWTALKLGRHRVRIGGDLYTSQGDIVNKPGSLGSPEGDLKISLPTIAEAPARNQGGVYVESELRAGARARFNVGARVDYWSVRSEIDVAVDPRLRATYDATDRLSLHAAFGLAHQPAVFFLPLPGLTEIAVDEGLTRAIQSELGGSYELPWDFRFEAQFFLHHYTGLLLPELVQDASIEDNPPLSDALAYGLELYLKRDLSDSITGWIGYTLGWATADSERSIGRFRPDFDVRHVLNAVLQWRVYKGFSFGGRLHARSGRVIEQLNPRYEQRLPWFVRGDVRFGYAWRGRYADMTAYLEWLNVGAQGEYLDADCLLAQCEATRAPPISIPNLGVRAEF